MENITTISAKVLVEHPTAYVKTYSRFTGNGLQTVFRVVDMNLNVLGTGNTEFKAWKDALQNT